MAAVVFKVFTLALKTAAKPIGFQFQSWALQHPIFKNNAIKFAQMIHSFEIWISRRAEGKEGIAFVGAISDEKAMALASKVVSEGFVFSVGVAVLIWEYTRSKKQESEKKAYEEMRKKEEKKRMDEERNMLQIENDKQQEMMIEILERIGKLENKMNHYQQHYIEKKRSIWTK